jgi:EAL domain-containing protein (putative c-di-GMP-specific phosphodiesterase class I)
MDTRVKERRQLDLDLRNALGSDEFELFYQPFVDTKTDEICGFEALLRWHHPERGMVPPDEFIPLAEENGLIIPLGEWVIREACATASAWPEHVKVAVNISTIQFASEDLVPTIINALSSSGLSPKRLELEITESIFLEDSETTLAILMKLRNLGVRIAMDDFGTGYSSLGYLRSFPFDKIKVDRSFLMDLTDRDDAKSIIRAVASLGSSLGMTTTAEGVETQEQLEIVKSLGYDIVQGFFYSPPRPALEMTERYFPAKDNVKIFEVA